MSTYLPFVISGHAEEILQKRYYCKTAGETSADQLWRRAALGNDDYYRLMSEGLFMPNSPTLFNAGTDHGGTLSACFVFDISDSLNGDWPPGGLKDTDPNSIIGTLFKASCVAKAGGGVGYYFGNLRERGALVRSVHRKACGPVSVLFFLHQLRNLITQGGKRDLAQMGVLPAEHPDIFDWIHCKDADPKALESFNISVSWRDHQMTAVFNENHPEHARWRRVWEEQTASAWRTGDPGMLFYDAINRCNATPHRGNVNATNPCGETPNLNNEPCNLGSLALLRFVDLDRRAIDWGKLEWAVRLSVRYLDHILDNNVFPHPDITAAALDTRKLGLGVMGWADTLALLGVHYDTHEAVDLATKTMKFINDTARGESVKLADEKGPYPAWEAAPDDIKAKFPRARNSTRTSIAPTGTIAILANCMSSIEPHFAHEWDRTTNEGIRCHEYIVVRDHMPAGFVPRIANEIGLEWHVRHQAAFQAHTDLGVSKTINLPKDATVEHIREAYALMWRLGCKGGTAFRDGCRDEQVLVAKPRSVYATARAAEPIEAGQAVTPDADGTARPVPRSATGLPDPAPLSTAELRRQMEEYRAGNMRRLTLPGDVPPMHAVFASGGGGIGAEHSIELSPETRDALRQAIDNPEVRFLTIAGLQVPAVTQVVGPRETKMPRRREGPTFEAKIGGVNVYLTANRFPDGRCGEIFLKVSRGGTTLDGFSDAWAIMVSKALQFGMPLEKIVSMFSGRRSDPAGMTGDPDVPNCTSIQDYVVRKLAKEFLQGTPGPMVGVPRMRPVISTLEALRATVGGPTAAGSLLVDENGEELPPPTPDYPGMMPGGGTPLTQISGPMGTTTRRPPVVGGRFDPTPPGEMPIDPLWPEPLRAWYERRGRKLFVNDVSNNPLSAYMHGEEVPDEVIEAYHYYQETKRLAREVQHGKAGDVIITDDPHTPADVPGTAEYADRIRRTQAWLDQSAARNRPAEYNTSPPPPAGTVSDSGMVCPDCGKPMRYVAGCYTCVPQFGGCGYNRCG